MDDLKRFRVPVLILSGGEPLLRPDIFEIAHRAKEMGFYVGLSSNGTLIDESNIDRIAAVGFDYVGVSLDGIQETHDKFRRMEGAFDASMHGIRLCKARGIKVGIRFTLTQDNAHDLPALLQLMEDEELDKFYLSHLNYAGRGNKNRKDDAIPPGHPAGDGPAVRYLLALSAGRAGTRNSSPATTMPTACICCSGCGSISPIWKTISAPSWRSGAAIRPA